jgi:hypothetical protein
MGDAKIQKDYANKYILNKFLNRDRFRDRDRTKIEVDRERKSGEFDIEKIDKLICSKRQRS